MAIGFWGYPNGNIPASAMYAIVSRGGTFYLREDAAYWWWRLSAEYGAVWGVPLEITDAYRSLAEQQYYWDAFQAGWGNVAAFPGQSNHGWACAVDIYTPSYGDSSSTPQHAWLRENAPKFGWTWTTGKASGESWHWEFTEGLPIPASAGSTPIPEDEMTAEDVRAINEHTDNANTALLKTILDAIRRDNNGRIIFDGGPKNTVPFDRATRAAITREGKIWMLPGNPVDRKKMIDQERKAGDGLFFALAENPDGFTSTAFNRQLEWEGPTGASGTTLAIPGLGTFVENTIELEGGATRQVYTERVEEYPHSDDVHRDGRPVRITKGGLTVERFVRSVGKSYAVVAGGLVELTAEEVKRADRQRASGQSWATS